MKVSVRRYHLPKNSLAWEAVLAPSQPCLASRPQPAAVLDGSGVAPDVPCVVVRGVRLIGMLASAPLFHTPLTILPNLTGSVAYRPLFGPRILSGLSLLFCPLLPE